MFNEWTLLSQFIRVTANYMNNPLSKYQFIKFTSNLIWINILNVSSITKQWFRDTGLRCWISTIFLIFTSSMCTGYFFWWYSNPKSTSHTFPITGKAMYFDVLYVFVYYLGIHKHIGEPACIILIPIGLDLVFKNFLFQQCFLFILQQWTNI